MRGPSHLDLPAGRHTFDLLRWPLVGPFLRWRHVRLALQWPLLGLAAVLIWHGLSGPQLAPKNLATVLTWVHYRGLLILALLVAGNAFCLACPLLLPRELARRFGSPRWTWPRRLRSKWLAVVLFAAILFAYERWALWSDPRATAALIGLYFALALVVDALFRHASFCKWLCPIGQFNFAASTMSPLEVAVRDPSVCASCRTLDCIKGRPADPLRFEPAQRGCELALFLPRKVGNLDCTFCMDCQHACPHDNVGLLARVPGAELFDDPRRSGVGRLSQRADLAALAVVFSFGALLNAFGMVRPVYAFQAALSHALGGASRDAVLAAMFALGLVVVPAILLAVTGTASRALAGGPGGLRGQVLRFAWSLVPLGFGMWLAHYSFHFFTGVWTVVPVAQTALAELGLNTGRPRWELGGLPEAQVYPIELGFLGLGLLGSCLVTWRIARRVHAAPLRAALPWWLLHGGMFGAAIWLLSQPMEMRGTFLGAG